MLPPISPEKYRTKTFIYDTIKEIATIKLGIYHPEGHYNKEARKQKYDKSYQTALRLQMPHVVLVIRS